MSVDPKILARMREARDPQDDGDTTPGLPGVVIPVSKFPGLPTLVGTPKQVKWAVTIRDDALDLSWPAETEAMLKTIVDSTWWIANKSIVHTMKFKEPSPHQIVGGPPPPKGRPSPGRSPSPATPSAEYIDAMTPLTGAPIVDPRPTSRLADVFGFAESVSRHPKTAEAAVLALMAKVYKGDMADAIRAKGRAVAQEAEFEFQRDLDAVNKMLA